MKNSEKEIMIGQHVDVYWANDDAFYPGVVANRRAQRNFDTLKYFIKYDDGDEGWVDSDEIRILNKSQCKLRQKQRKLLRNRVKKLEVNTRVKVSSITVLSTFFGMSSYMKCTKSFSIFFIGLVAFGKIVFRRDFGLH